MERLRHGLLIGCGWFALILLGAAQDISTNLYVAPTSGILDTDGFLSTHPEKVAQITATIQKLQREHGFKLFLVIEPILIGVNVPQRAGELRQRWVPDGDGLVVVYESSSRQLAVGWDIVGGQILQDALSQRIPSLQTSAMLSRALAAPDPHLPPEDYLAALMKNLGSEFDHYFNGRHVSPPPERTLKITLVIVGTLALLGLASMIAAFVVRFTSVSAVQAFRFPEVEAVERLAAPCGASVTTRRFASPR